MHCVCVLPVGQLVGVVLAEEGEEEEEEEGSALLF